jgi:nifR3 family TIM-barrel protein
MNSFWDTLRTPFFVMAPLEDVTDAAFRRVFAATGKPDITWTEFTSADGLVLAPEPGKTKLLKKLLFSDAERPIVAQLFSSVPERMEKAAALAQRLGFDGIDINMGCPDKAVEKQGCGAALIKNPPLARALIRAAKAGAANLPVSVKTRIGYSKNELATWLPELLAEDPVAVTIHARTRQELSDVPARWEHVREAVAIRDALGSKARIIGNGDVKDMADARAKVAASGADGAMFGRALFGNPWVFIEPAYVPTPKERIEKLAEHIRLFDELLGDTVNFATMKKHFKSYLHGWDHAKDLRLRMMETMDAPTALAVLASASQELA